MTRELVFNEPFLRHSYTCFLGMKDHEGRIPPLVSAVAPLRRCAVEPLRRCAAAPLRRCAAESCLRER